MAKISKPAQTKSAAQKLVDGLPTKSNVGQYDPNKSASDKLVDSLPETTTLAYRNGQGAKLGKLGYLDPISVSKFDPKNNKYMSKAAPKDGPVDTVATPKAAPKSKASSSSSSSQSSYIPRTTRTADPKPDNSKKPPKPKMTAEQEKAYYKKQSADAKAGLARGDSKQSAIASKILRKRGKNDAADYAEEVSKSGPTGAYLKKRPLEAAGNVLEGVGTAALMRSGIGMLPKAFRAGNAVAGAVRSGGIKGGVEAAKSGFSNAAKAVKDDVADLGRRASGVLGRFGSKASKAAKPAEKATASVTRSKPGNANIGSTKEVKRNNANDFGIGYGSRKGVGRMTTLNKSNRNPSPSKAPEPEPPMTAQAGTRRQPPRGGFDAKPGNANYKNVPKSSPKAEVKKPLKPKADSPLYKPSNTGTKVNSSAVKSSKKPPTPPSGKSPTRPISNKTQTNSQSYVGIRGVGKAQKNKSRGR